MSPTLHYPAHPDAIRSVRTFVRDQVADPSHADDIVLIASELATNAIKHAHTPFTVTIENSPLIRLEVTDHSPHIPITIPSPNTRGHGLHILDKLADRWGIESSGNDKTVWVELGLIRPHRERVRLATGG